MIVGFIGFGMVSSTISNILSKNGIKTVTVVKGRSAETEKLAIKSDVQIIDSYEALIKGSDIVISANLPSQALNIAETYADLVTGIYLDLNNISPNTTKSIGICFEKDALSDDDVETKKSNFFSKEKRLDNRSNFVDGAIIGKVNNDNKPIILISGEKVDDLVILNNYGLKIIVVSKEIGDVSTLKMLRSLYTKGVSAVLMETFEVAKQLKLEDELFEILSMTEGSEFRGKAESRIANSYLNANRKSEEIDEALNFLNSLPSLKNYILTEATKNKFYSLKK